MNPRFQTLLLAVGLMLPGLAFAESSIDLLARENLVAWCIVPFDASQRGPAERAEMLADLQLMKSAYDWREKHVPTFEDEIQQYQKHGIELFAFWRGHEEAYQLFEKYDIHPQIWMTVPSPPEDAPVGQLQAAIDRLLLHVKRAGEAGCQFGLYNHGGWGGEPASLVAICERLREMGHEHVGIVYNFHHAHDQIETWAEGFALMEPYLLCLNLNGMNADADPKILTLGEGQFEKEMIEVVLNSDYDGPIGILDHQNDVDTREALEANLEGLKALR